MTTRIDVSEVIERQAQGKFQITLLLLVAFAAFLEGFDAQIQGYTAPTITKLWHISRSSFSPVFVYFQIGFMIGAICLGNLGDIIGRRLMIILGVLFFGIFTIAGAYASDVSMLAATRFVSAVFLGGAVPNAIALTIDYSPQRRRALNVGIMYTLYTVGGSAGGFLSAWFVPHLGWQSIYWICGTLAILFCVVLIFGLPESARFMTVRGRNPASLSRTLKKVAPGLEIPADAEFYLSGPVAPKKAWVGELFAEKRAVMTIALWAGYGINLIALIFVTSWMPIVFADAGISVSRSLIATSLFQGGGAVGSIIGGLVLDRNKGILRLWAICLAAVPVIIGIGFSAGYPALLMALACCAGICIIGTQTGLNALSGYLYPISLRSTGAGWANGIGRLGAVLGPLLGGVLINFHLTLTAIFMIVAVPSLCVSIFILIMNTTRPRSAAVA